MTDEQPPSGADPGATRDPAIDRLLRRSLLMLTRPAATVQDRFDFADLADAVDAPAAAALVRNSAMLRQGFAPASPNPILPQGSIERAVYQLKALMDNDRADATSRRVDVVDAVDATASCAAFAQILAAPLDGEGEAKLAGLLAAWRGLAEATPVHPGDHVSADLAELLTSFAVNELQAFLRRNHVIAFPPYGSAQLLHSAAQLETGGLGPYFSGINNVVRGSQDVLGLIALASGDQASAMVERWTALLANRLHETTAIALADDIADLGMIGAVRGLLDAASRQPERLGLMRHLRDAALDLGDIVLALSAQHIVLARVPYDLIEWRCLGAMLVAANDSAAADAALVHALKLAPGDKDATAQLAALRAGDFSRYAVQGGFTTSSQRQRMRSARRAA